MGGRVSKQKKASLQDAYFKTPNGKARFIMGACRRNAAKKGLELEIGVEDIAERIARGRCEVTGIPFELSRRSPWQPSVDRIDSSKGYVPSNIRVVVWIFNAACNSWGDEPVYRLAAAIARRRKAAAA